MFDQILLALSWLLLPVLACRAGRRLVPASAPAPCSAAGRRLGDPPSLSWLYNLLLLLLIAGALRLVRSERLDFALALVIISAVGGVIWALDAWVLRPRARPCGAGAGKDPLAVPEPGVVDYARSMVPVVVFVLVLRSFLFEPFRIPSDSMMPTLQDGDFILVNKFAYGLRLPVLEHQDPAPSASRSAAMWWCSATRPIRPSTTSSGWSACRATG